MLDKCLRLSELVEFEEIILSDWGPSTPTEMNTTLLRQKISTLLVVVLVISINCRINCSTIDDGEEIIIPAKLRSSIDTLNYFHGLLPEQVGLAEKCKKYAVLLSMIDSVGLLYVTTVEKLSALPEDIISRHHQKMSPKTLSILFMSAIDKYRTSGIAPPFLDLIECLKQINESIAEKYLDDRQLETIIHIYQQVLKSPNKQVDLNDFNLSVFHKAFQVNLRSILRGHLGGRMFDHGREPTQPSKGVQSTDARCSLPSDDRCNVSNAESSSSMNSLNRAQSKYRRSRSQREQGRVLQLLQDEQLQLETDSTESVPDPLAKKRRGRPPVVDEKELEERRIRRRLQARIRDRRRRLGDPVRYREERRLRQQRKRIIHAPDAPKSGEQGAERNEQLGRLELKQLQSQLQVHLIKRQKLNQPQPDRYLATRRLPDPMSSSIVSAIEMTSPPVQLVASPVPREQERQQLGMQPERVPITDELFPGAAPDRHSSDNPSHPFHRPHENDWPDHNRLSSQHVFDAPTPALSAQSEKTLADASPHQALLPVVSPHVFPSLPSDHIDSVQNQTRTGVESENVFTPVPFQSEEHEAHGNRLGAGSQEDYSNELSFDIEAILRTPDVGNSLFKSDAGEFW